MPLGYKSGSIRSGISLSDEQLNTVLQCMTRAVTVQELCEGTGLERHTADAIRYKVMYAIATHMDGIQLKNPAVVAFSSVKTSEKGAKVCVLDSKPRLKAIFAVDSTAQCIGMAGSPDSVVSGYSPDGYLRGTLSTSAKEQLLRHGITKYTVHPSSTRITDAWELFIAHFRGIATKYLGLYIAWFCYLWNAEVIGKTKEDIASDLWALINKTERTVSNRRR